MDHPNTVTGWRRTGYLLLAALFFALGAAGMVLPGLPTTPFLLLTSFLLIRSYPSLNNRLLNSRFFGPILLDWNQHRGVRWHIKLKTVALVLIVLAVSLYVGHLTLPMKLGVVVLAFTGLVVVMRLPTVPANPSTPASTIPLRPDAPRNTPVASETRVHPLATTHRSLPRGLAPASPPTPQFHCQPHSDDSSR